MKLLGRPLADQVKLELLSRPLPKGEFVIVQARPDRVSEVYVSKKKEFADELGVKVRLVKTDENKITEVIEELNQDKNVQGILLQLPLPVSLDRDSILSKVSISKDVDGFHYILNTPGAQLVPPTVTAICELLKFYNVSLENGVLIVGGGFLVGRPLDKFFKISGIKSDILDKNDPDYRAKLSSADVIVVATGVGQIFSGNEFKAGATVIDASTVASEQSIAGDVKIEDESKINLAPVPGGVGPVTVAMLYKNLYDLSEN